MAPHSSFARFSPSRSLASPAAAPIGWPSRRPPVGLSSRRGTANLGGLPPVQATAQRSATSAPRGGPLDLAPRAANGGDDDLTFALTPLLRSGLVLAGGGRDTGDGSGDPSSDAPPRDD